MRDHQRLTKSHLQFWPEDQCQKKRSTLISPFPHQESHGPEEKHHPDVENGIIHSVHPCDAEKDDKRKKDLLWNPEDIGEEGNKRQVEYEQDEVANIHTGDHAPEEFRVLADYHGAWIDSMDEKGTKKNGRRRSKGNSKDEEGNEGSLAGGVVCQFRSSYSFNRSFAKLLRVF